MSLNLTHEHSDVILRPNNYRDMALKLFVNAQKEINNFRIGTEHELFMIDENKKPVPYFGPDGIAALLNKMAKNPEATGKKLAPIYESGHIIALASKDCSITLEPGGQIELSGAQAQSIHEIFAEINWFHGLLKKCMPQEHSLIYSGFHPSARREDFSWVPKERYAIMRDYMPTKGKLGLDMMLRTCTVQANLDYSSEDDCIQSFRTALALSPIVAALFAASPFKEGRPTGRLSERIHTWSDTDNERTGFPQLVFADDFGYAAWIEFALDVPMYFIRRDGHHINAAGFSFREFIKHGFQNHTATLLDFQDHLSTIFTEARLKPYIEVRSADCGPVDHLYALPAFWKGILYDQDARQKAWQLMQNPTSQELASTQSSAAALGLKAQYKGKTLLSLAEELLNLAQYGLKKQNVLNADNQSEEVYLKALFEIVERQETYAEYLLRTTKIA